MISPELLRRYPFFSFLDDNHLKAVAMIAEEENHPGGTNILQSGDPADALYLLMKGSVDLFYVVQEEFHPSSKKEFLMGEVNPEEPFGISALIEPYQYTASARAPVPVSVIKIFYAKSQKQPWPALQTHVPCWLPPGHRPLKHNPTLCKQNPQRVF